jgi:hypothetical protein
MSTLSRFYGVTIKMYVREHPPAHFHAEYGEFEALIAIDTLQVLTGRLPRRALAFVLEWASQHREELRDNWERAVRHDVFVPIDPLD